MLHVYRLGLGRGCAAAVEGQMFSLNQTLTQTLTTTLGNVEKCQRAFPCGRADLGHRVLERPYSA